MNKCKKSILLFALAACLLLAAGGIVWAAEEVVGDNTVASGVFIDGIGVGGMTTEEAQEAVEEYISFLKDSRLVLSFNGAESGISMSELGFVWENPEVVAEAAALGNTGNILQRYKMQRNLANNNVTLPIKYSWDETLLQAFLQKEADERQTEPVDAELTFDVKKKEFTVTTESVTGLTVDVASTMKTIKDTIADGWNGGDLTIEAAAEVIEPLKTTEMLASVGDLLGEFQTPYDVGQTDRNTNLAVACGYINGMLLMPGEHLSFFETVYPITVERGYREGIAYQGGRYVDSLGGGLCQVSTTAYNAALLAEMEILSRAPHSMTVSYVRPGLDSGQAWSSKKNLSFANNTDYPVYVEAHISKGVLYVGLWGKETRPENRTVRYGSDWTEEYVYADRIIYEYDPSLPYGYEHTTQGDYPRATGHAYKEVLIDGKVVSKEYLSDEIDKYTPTPNYVTVGTGGLTAEEYLAGATPPGYGNDNNNHDSGHDEPQTPPPTEAPTQPPATEAPTQPVTPPPTEPTTPPTEPDTPPVSEPEPPAGVPEVPAE